MKSGDPTSGATGTGSISAATSKNMFDHGPVFFCICDFSSSRIESKCVAKKI